MSQSRDSWLARRDAAAHLLPPAVVSVVRADRRLRGWQVILRGSRLVPLGSPGRVLVGGRELRDVSYNDNEIRGWLDHMPRNRDVVVDLGAVGRTSGRLTIGRRFPRLWSGWPGRRVRPGFFR